MPQAVAFTIGELAITWATVITYAIAAISAYENARKARAMRRKAIEDYNNSLEDRLRMTATANGARSRCYGRVRNVDGIVFKGTWSPTSEMYTLVVALAGHEIDGIETIYFNDVPVSLQADGVFLPDGRQGYWVTTPPILQSPSITEKVTVTVVGGTGSVTIPHTAISGSMSAIPHGFGSTGTATVSQVGTTLTVTATEDGDWEATYQYVGFFPQARLWKYLGAPGQDLSPLLISRFPSLISSTDKFTNIACLVVELQFNVDAWPTGVPEISAVFRGAKLTDPRMPGSSYEWSENPAAIAYDWAMHANGGGAMPDELDKDAFIAAANACDVSTSFITTAGTEVRPLYQCGIVCRFDGNPDDVFDEIVESMAGKWGWGGGVLTCVAGVYRAPVAHITTDWVMAGEGSEAIVIVKDAPRADLVNVYRPTIANAESYIDGTGPSEATATTYTATPLPEVRSEAFITADGQELPREISLGGVTRSVHAQHICGVLMREARDGMVLRLPCNMRAWQLELFDVVTVTLPFFGFAAKEFEIIGWKYSIEGGVLLTLKETSASIYNPSSGLSVLNAAVNSTLPLPWYVPQLTGLAVTSGTAALEDGTQQTRARVTWDVSTMESVLQAGKIEVQYTELVDVALPAGDWPTQTVEGSATEAVITGLKSGTGYVFRVRAINTLGVRSVWSLQVSHVIAVPTAVADAAQAALDAAEALAQLAEITSDNVLAAGEKPPVILDVTVITSEQADIDAKATAQAITTEKTAYDTAVTALTTYLATLTAPVAWNNLTDSTTIVGTTFRSKFADVYSTRQTLLNLIAVKIAAGAVGTDELDDYAATDDYLIETALTSYTYPSSHPQGVNVYPLASQSYTNATTKTVLVELTCTANMDLPTTGISEALFRFEAWTTSAGVGTRLGGKLVDSKQFLGAAASNKFSVLMAWQYRLAPGASANFEAQFNGTVASAGAAGTAEDITLRTVAIKR